MKKRVGSIAPGENFLYGGEWFVVLEQMGEGTFCLLEQGKKPVPFNTGSGKTLNDYRKSTLRRETEREWLPKLIANGARYEDLIPFDVDLRPIDQSKGYGELLGVPAAPLTIFQYGKYKDIIPLNEDNWWWLVTPWSCPWIRSTQENNDVWRVDSDGFANYASRCSYSYSNRPALKLKSDRLVSIDGEDEDPWNISVAEMLRATDTLALVREVERRLSERICLQQQAEKARDVEDEPGA